MVFVELGDGGDALAAWRTALSRSVQHGWMELKEEELERSAESNSPRARTVSDGES